MVRLAHTHVCLHYVSLHASLSTLPPPAASSSSSFTGLQFKTMYLPWVLTAFHVLMGNDIVSDLMGIAAGHMYYAFKEVLPQSQGPLRGKQLLPTPLFL